MDGTASDVDYVVTPSKVGLAERRGLFSYGLSYRRGGTTRGEFDSYGQRKNTTVMVWDGLSSIWVPSWPLGSKSSIGDVVVKLLLERVPHFLKPLPAKPTRS